MRTMARTLTFLAIAASGVLGSLWVSVSYVPIDEQVERAVVVLIGIVASASTALFVADPAGARTLNR